MPHPLGEVGPPSGEIYRVGWHSDPLAPPPWHLAADDGTFGNRFDDPERWFRCISWGSTPEAAFGETLARFRVSPPHLATIKAAVSDAEDLADIFGEELDFTEPAFPRGIIPRPWRGARRLVTTMVKGRGVGEIEGGHHETGVRHPARGGTASRAPGAPRAVD